LANNQSVKQALNHINATVEGLNTLELVLSIAQKHHIEMPICEQVNQVIQNQATPTEPRYRRPPSGSPCLSKSSVIR
jgi:glycerol-3-phosphate dehydrogenase (NAD(P)+)